jgi:hypothetical protein
MVDGEDAGVGKTQAKWEIWEAKYKKAKIKIVCFWRQRACALPTKSHALDSKILLETKRPKEAINL